MASPLRRQATGPGTSPPALARLAGPAALLALVAFVLPGVVTGGALYLRDINMVWLPQVESFVRGVAAGSWPLWDPFSGLGRPLLADPRAEILYPPTWLNLVLRPATYYALFTAAHLLLAGAGMARLAREDGLGLPAAATAAGTWVAGGPLLSLVSMWHHLAAAAWLPWVALAFERLLRRPSSRRLAVAAGALAAQVLAGSPEITALTAAVVMVWTASGLRHAEDGRATRLGGLAAAAALGLALSAAQWLPTLDVVSRSTRAAGGGTGGTWSLHPQALFELVLPLRWADLRLKPAAALDLLEGKEPWMRSVYLGAASLPLAMAGLVARRERRGALAVLLLASLLLSLGPHGPLAALAGVVPAAGALRYPVKLLLVTAFAWSLLAACGVQALAEGSRAARVAAVAVAGTVTVAAVVAWIAWHGGGPGAGPLGDVLAAPIPDWARRPLVPAGALALAAGVIAAARGRALSPPAAAALLALLAVTDLAWRHRELNPTAPRALFAYRPEVLRALAGADGARTYVYDYSMDPGVSPSRARPWPYTLARQPQGWTPSAALVLGVHAYLNPPTAARWGVFGSYDLDILGFDSAAVDALTRRLREVEETPAHLRLLQLGAVGHVLALEPAPWWRDLTPVDEVAGFFTRPIRVFRVPAALPRAYVVDGVRVASGEAALATLVDPGFDPAREVVLGQGTPRAPAEGLAGTVALDRIGWDAVEATVDMTRDGVLVLVDAYDPGWRARVDGRAAPVWPANVAFRAIPVPAGRHHVRLAYRPPAIGGGLALSALGVLAAALLLRRHRSDPGGQGTGV